MSIVIHTSKTYRLSSFNGKIRCYEKDFSVTKSEETMHVIVIEVDYSYSISNYARKGSQLYYTLL